MRLGGLGLSTGLRSHRGGRRLVSPQTTLAEAAARQRHSLAGLDSHVRVRVSLCAPQPRPERQRGGRGSAGKERPSVRHGRTHREQDTTTGRGLQTERCAPDVQRLCGLYSNRGRQTVPVGAVFREVANRNQRCSPAAISIALWEC